MVALMIIYFKSIGISIGLGTSAYIPLEIPVVMGVARDEETSFPVFPNTGWLCSGYFFSFNPSVSNMLCRYNLPHIMQQLQVIMSTLPVVNSHPNSTRNICVHLSGLSSCPS